MTREQAEKVFKNARHIFVQSRLGDVRRAAKEIAVQMEEAFGPIGSQPAADWEV